MTRPYYEGQHFAQPSEVRIDVAAKGRMPVWARILLALLGLALLAGCLAGIGAALSGASTGDRHSTLATGTTGPGGQPAASPPAAEGKRLTARDVTVTLKTTDKECFGSAGCTVTVTPRLSWPTGQDPTGAYDVTYVISYKTIDFDGSGSRISNEQTVGTARIIGDGDQYESESHMLMTAERSTRITVKVDDVERRL